MEKKEFRKILSSVVVLFAAFIGSGLILRGFGEEALRETAIDAILWTCVWTILLILIKYKSK